MSLDKNFLIRVIPLYLNAIKTTLFISLISLVISIIIGIICIFIMFFNIKILKNICKFYIELFRNTPLLIQVFILYFGITKFKIYLGEQTCGIVGLSLLGGSYFAESFRSGIESIKKSQIESGLSIGLNKFQLFIYILFPQTIKISFAGISANIIFIIKETSILASIAVEELFHTTKSLIGIEYKTYEALLLLTIGYFIIIVPISLILYLIKRRISYV